MPSWTDFTSSCYQTLGFFIGLSVLLHLIAFKRPEGQVSKRLHPVFLDPQHEQVLKQQDQVIKNQETPIARLNTRITLLETLAGQRDGQARSLGDLELVTRVVRRSRRTAANSSFADGRGWPAL